MDTPDTFEGWQKFFADLLPDEGALLTFCQTTPDAAGFDDSPQSMAAGPRIMRVEEHGDAELFFWDIKTGSVRQFWVESIEDAGEGRYYVTTPEKKVVIISKNYGEDQRAALRHWIEES